MADETPESIQFVNADPGFIVGANTFRKGDKYAGLRPGDTIGAQYDDAGAGETLLVGTVVIGTLADLLVGFAEENHGVREAIQARQIDTNVFAQRYHLREILTEIYGELQDDDLFTVIFFTAVVEDEEGQIDPPAPGEEIVQSETVETEETTEED